jgi:adenylate kinase
MLNIVLFGPPGAGKGTQSKNLINKYKLVHLSTGEMLRAEIAAGTEMGAKADALISKGEFVDDQMVIDLISSEIDKHKGGNGFVFDGFPRTTAQAFALDELLQGRSMHVNGMIALEVPKAKLMERLTLRGQDSGRADDASMAVIEKRITIYHNLTKPVADFYEY